MTVALYALVSQKDTHGLLADRSSVFCNFVLWAGGKIGLRGGGVVGAPRRRGGGGGLAMGLL